MPDRTWIVLLRGINLGRARRVAMADLRALLRALGYRTVRTVRNSGNAILDAAGAHPDDLAARIEAAVVERLGVSSRVIVLSAAELTAVVLNCPWPEPRARTQVAFLADPADRARLEPLLEHSWDREALALGERVAYLRPAAARPSPLLKAIDEALGDRVTTRTWSTVEKVAQVVALSESRRASSSPRPLCGED
jgi:uncharacterized protein (DUF1697 family)